MLYAGDDWAEDHHDVALVDQAGRRLARARLSEGMAGIARFHELIADHLPESDGPGQVVIGIETDRGPWVTALVASGYQVYAVNPLSVSRYRERHSVSGAKSDAGDAWLLADLVRTDAARHRPVAGYSPAADGIKVLARAHQRLIWERNRTVLRLRSTLREYFPAALAAFPDLDAPDALELLARAPEPHMAARLSRAQIAAALNRAGRRQVQRRAEEIMTALRAPQLSQPGELTAAYAAAVISLTQVIAAFSEQIEALGQQVSASFRHHAAAGIYLSQPGLGVVLAARVLGEFGDDPHRYASAKGRKNYASTSPITRASGKKTAVLARYARNDRLADTRSTSGRLPRYAPPPAPAATTTSSAAGARPTAPRCASSATGWPASCTAA
jgi:Transposase/Transposase IS116/IS110/IS902 family